MLNKVKEWLCGFEGDKYVHVLTCQLIAFLTGKICSMFLGRWCGAAIGFVVAAGAGFFKEIDDDTFDYGDFKADMLGAIWGALYCLI